MRLTNFPIMNILRTLLLCSSSLLLVGCKDDASSSTKSGTSTASAQDFELVSRSALNDAMKKLLEQYPLISLPEQSQAQIEQPIARPDGSQLVLAKIPVRITERLISKEVTPEELNVLRRQSNDVINQAMMPESGYLMQIGAPTSALRDEDRQAKALPPELKGLADELKQLAEQTVYVITYEEGVELTLEAKIVLTQSDNQVWGISSIDIDDRPLLNLKRSERASAHDQGITILTPEWLKQRSEQITQRCKSFAERAAPYIAQREEAARRLLVERITAIEEQRRRVLEAATKTQQEYEETKMHFEELISNSSLYAGEWHQGDDFGKLSLRMDKAEILDNTIHFVGAIFDTELPEAMLDIAGRVELSSFENGKAAIHITIYDGKYDPDEPTAMVYDAKDGVLRLQMDKDNRLTGVMTCSSWSADDDRNFKIRLAPIETGEVIEEEPAPEPTPEENAAESTEAEQPEEVTA